MVDKMEDFRLYLKTLVTKLKTQFNPSTEKIEPVVAEVAENGTHAAGVDQKELLSSVLSLLVRLALSVGVSYFLAKWLSDIMDPTRKEKKASQKRAQEILKRLGCANIQLTDYELCFAADLLDPESIQTSWHDIGGLDDIIKSIKENVIFPFKRQDLFTDSVLLQPPKGVLLYGPPGCGKTMIAKALARDAGARFVNFQVSSLVDKWYGESQKRAEAVFTLAVKLQPAIIFIDEIDSFLRSRNSRDHEATAMIKAQFMSLWDGIITNPRCQVIVVGATNRPQDIDAAILRRMPCMFNIGKPQKEQRRNVLQLILRTEDCNLIYIGKYTHVASTPQPEAWDYDEVDFDQLSEMTEEFSGSELKEVCRLAATNRIHELVDLASKSHTDDFYNMEVEKLRQISMSDLVIGVNTVRESKKLITNNMYSFTLD